MLNVIVCLLALASAAATPTLDQIIERHIAARGGRERIGVLKSLVFRGEYREGDHVSPHAAMALMRPYYKLVGDPDQKLGAFAEGYDGSAWEYYGNPGVVLRTVGPAAAAGRHGARFDNALIDYRAHGATVDLIGTADVAGRSAYRLLVTLQDGFRYQTFIDRESWLVCAERRTAPIHAFGEKVTSETRFTDYRAVEGVLFSFRSEEVEIDGGKVLNEFITKSIVANHDYGPAVFSPPEFKRTALQKWLEDLYAARDDASAVLWSYRDFRQAYPAIDTHGGVEFIGYQMLKMGTPTTAIELLKANARDYPRAATAAFGLGRAYKAAGDIANARKELQRALDLDPNYKRAAETLKSIPN
jgi:tetratricopeptide (TPR) repeat protein